MRHAMTKLGQSQQALYYAERALAAAPGEPDLIVLHAMTLADCGKLEDATRRMEPCVQQHPQHILARATLARMYGVQERLGDCLKTCVPALQAGQVDHRLMAVYAAALLRVGRADEAVNLMKHIAMARTQSTGVMSGGDPHHLSALANSMLYDHTATPGDLFAAHFTYGRLLNSEVPVPPTIFSQSFDPERKLRFGIVSPDLRIHPSTRFLEPILENIDRERFEVVLYSTSEREDEFTERYKRLADLWRPAVKLSVRELTDRIRADAVDVLLDAAGHTQGNRLLSFHLRPAPVQATWLGYPNSTGLSAMGYRIVDSITDPVGFDSQSTEKLVRIDPCFVCYRPPPDVPEVDPTPPSQREGAKGITFVCYNAIQKTNKEVVAAWGRILREVRGSRLLMRHRATLQEDVRQDLAQRIAAAGASREQVVVQPPADGSAKNMVGYQDADVALDTFPYPGVTTTCEALWMGVPVVSIEGKSAASRQGLSIMHAGGLSEFVVKTPDDYVALAVKLAADAPRRAELRRTLRPTLAASALRDEKGYTRKFENALRTMWRERCAAGNV